MVPSSLCIFPFLHWTLCLLPLLHKHNYLLSRAMEPLCWVLSSSWVRDRVTAQGPHQSGVYSDSHRAGQANELIVGMDAMQNYNREAGET